MDVLAGRGCLTRLIFNTKGGVSTGGGEDTWSKEFFCASLLSSCYPKAMFIEEETISLGTDRNPSQGPASPHNSH